MNLEAEMRLEISLNHILDPDAVRLFLAEFERQHNVTIDLQIFTWADAWAELLKISLYERGAVLSEAGTTWMGSLAAKNCLRPFRKNEIAMLGGGRMFLPEAWQTCLDDDNETVLAVPWSLNTYLIYYRRDILAKAGVDEAAAFTTYENFIHTLESLLKIGVNMPVAIPTAGNSRQVFHNASCFVWSAGGEFTTPDGKRVLFSDPRTLAGLKDYYSLHRFLASPARHLLDDACNDAFLDGRAAITLRSPDLLYQIRHGRWPEDVTKNTGVAVQPGVPFVGGSNLVIWRHIPPAQETRAVELIQYLTSRENMLRLFSSVWLIPANIEALNEVEANPEYTVIAQSLKAGRTFKRVPLWGLIEDKLTKALNHIWQTIFATPQPDVDRIIRDELLSLEERLNITLSQE